MKSIRELAAKGYDTAARHYREAGIAVALAVPMLAQAQAASDPFDTAITDATAKIGSYGAALVGVSAVGVVFMIAMKYVKRIPRAS